LDNARYAPTLGRFKVYLIDEVHMLSKPAFNSMLKTLEEPPGHVKFVLATTDPQKIPVTVLSRCLQFNLKALSPALIVARMTEILTAEGIAFDAGALGLIARAAHGSMRDALSVLDQAIAHGAGEVHAESVRTMLGAVDSEHVYRIADALLAIDGASLLAESRALSDRGLALPSALEELASLFHRIAVAQTVPETIDALPDAEKVATYAAAMTPEAVQLAYQICVQGRADLALAPDEATGFSMTLLRLLAFEPMGAPTMNATPMPAPARTASSGAALHRATRETGPVPQLRREAAPASISAAAHGAVTDAAAQASPPARASAPTAAPAAASAATTSTVSIAIADWPAFVSTLKLSGIAAQLAAQTELKAQSGNEFVLGVPEAARHLTDKTYTDKLKAALEESFARKVRLSFEIGGATTATLAAQEKRERAAAQAKTEAAFRDDPFVQDVLARFDAKVRPDSIKPTE
ncbi:MAG: DNA polymerase III subunit gamma/tau C-terminal domain-containing protein, partial [Casimicrobiaceae bacterium]